MKNIIKIITSTLIFATVSLTLSAEITDVIQESFDVKPGGLFVIESTASDIVVNSTSDNVCTIEIVRTLSANSKESAEEILNELSTDISENDGNVSVIIKNKSKTRGWFNFKKKKYSLKIIATVPHEFDLNLKTSGGDIEISNVDGDISLKTMGGSLELFDCSGVFNLKTAGGNIEAENISGEGSFKTTGGDIEIENGNGEFIAKTTGGDLEFTNMTGSLIGKTTGGDVLAHIVSDKLEPITLETMGGDVRLIVFQDSSFDLSAETFGGDVVCKLPLSDIEVKKSSKLVGVVSEGGSLVKLKTFGGDILIKSKAN